VLRRGGRAPSPPPDVPPRSSARRHAVALAPPPIPAVQIDPQRPASMPGARPRQQPSARSTSAARRTASVSWLVSPCRAQPTRPAPPQPPAIQRFAGYRSHRPAGHSTRGCAGGAYTEGLTPHVRLVDAPRTPGLDLVGANAMIWRTPVAPQGGSSLWASKRPNFRAPSPLYRATNLSNHAVAWGCHTPSTWIGIGC
jgi:hypothetical protein